MIKLLSFLLLLSCSHQPHGKQAKVALVFIQGYHLDETSWDEVRDYIPSEEFESIAFGRSGRESEKASLRKIADMSCQSTPKHAVLVAHSFGGAIANAMVGICPEKIKRIIYVSAIVPQHGEKPFARVKSGEDQKNYAEAVSFDKKFITPKKPKAFFTAIDPDVDLGSPTLPKIYAESLSLTVEEVHYDPKTFHQILKSYIFTERDPVVGLKTQKMFAKGAQIENTGSVATGHFPMISRPKLLAELILKMARE